MEHLDMTTPDGAQLNLDALYRICPSCFTETASEDGSVKRAVDWNKLRTLLGDNAVEDAPEAYDFTWVGKRAAQREAAAPIIKTLRPCPEESVDWENTQNLYIEGDNLEVLKLLQNSYMGKVKMIYIDPPYNTGNDFVYHDDFAQSADEYDEHNFNEDGERFRRNTDSNGRFHSDWCSMMYSRLMVARTLLKEDGVIFISIDDNEMKNLKGVCDEIFGEKNFVATITRRTKVGGGSAAHHFAIENDFILVYGKNKECLSDIFVPFDSEYIKRYKYEDEVGKYFWDTMERACTATVPYKIEAPDGTMLEGNWFRSESRFLEDKAKGEIRFIRKDNGKWSVQFKQRIAEGKKMRSIFNDNEFKSTQDDLIKLNLDGTFSFPKPVYLLKYIIQGIVKNGELILDFFSGSATTAQAVMELNSENEDERKFILVQLPELTEDKSEAYKAGFKNICEIGKERIRRAGNQIKSNIESKISTLESSIIKMMEAKPDNMVQLLLKDQQEEIARSIYKEQIEPKIKEKEHLQEILSNLDTGFRVFKCDESNMKDVYFSPKEYSQDLLSQLEDNIKDDRTDLDLLFDCMLRWGVELSLPLASTKAGACTIHNVNDGDLVACFDGKITEDIIDAIAAMKPLRVVFRDSSFTEAAQKMNLFELFKQKCGWSEAEVRNNVRVM